MDRFLKAQEHMFDVAVEEIRKGVKVSHWIWYVFPQIKGLGCSRISNFYALSSIDEAKAYLEHPVLGHRLRDICRLLLTHKGKLIFEIFDDIDAMKVQSSMTLFHAISPSDVFKEVLIEFYEGKVDYRTWNILKAWNNNC